MKLRIALVLVSFSLFFIGSTRSVSAYSQNFHKESYVNLPTACAGVRFWVSEYFTGNTVDISLNNVEVFSRNWANRTTRELTLMGTYPGGFGHQFRYEDLRNGGGGCLLDANNIYVRFSGGGGGYQNFFFDAPLVQPPGVAGNATLNVDIILFTNNHGYGTGNVGLQGPNDGTNGGPFTSNVFPDRSAVIMGIRDPGDPGVIPSIGSYFDYGLRLIVGAGPEGFQWASPEMFYPGFHSGGDSSCSNPYRHLSDNAPGIAPPPAIAFCPVPYPDANSHGTQMYKPGTNFTDPFPYDGLYTYNWTYGIGPWNAGNPGNPSVMSPQQSYWAGHAISQADQTAQSFHLATDIRPASITINGAMTGAVYNPGQNMSFTAAIQNYSAGIAANTGTPITFSLIRTTDNAVMMSSSATLGSFINPGGVLGATSALWFSVVGNYRIDVCANNPVTRYTVQGAPVCASSPFTVGVAFTPTPTYTPTPTPTPTPVTYTVKGDIFDDLDKSNTKTGTEGNVTTGSPIIVVTNMGTGITTNFSTTAGSYTVTGLPAGTYRIGVSSLPSGYALTFPIGFGYQVAVPCVSTILSILPNGGNGSCE